MNHRNAFTLVELSVSMTVGSALLVLAIGTLHQSMSLASTARARSDQSRTLNRLAQEFRSDAHRAAQCIVASPASMQLVISENSRITYEIDGSRIARREQLADGLMRRESFQCGEGASVTFELLSQPTRAVLTVKRKPHQSGQPSRVDRNVEAVVGRLFSHEKAEVLP